MKVSALSDVSAYFLTSHTYRSLKDKGVKFVTEPKDQPWGVRDATFVDLDGNKFVIESFQCKVCGKICKSYRELLEEHLRKHK